MTTIRRRLTFWYTVALGVTVVAFGTLLYLERRSSSLRELDQRLLLEADLADRWLSESYNVLGRIVTTAGSRPALDPGISAYLDAVRDYLVVADTSGQVLALSDVARELDAADLQRLTGELDSLRVRKQSGNVDLGPPHRDRALSRGAGGPRRPRSRAASWWRRSLAQVAFGPSALLQSMLLIAPVILAGRRRGRLLAGGHQPPAGRRDHGRGRGHQRRPEPPSPARRARSRATRWPGWPSP